MKQILKFYGYRAPKTSEDKRLSRLKKAYHCKNNSRLFDRLLTEADEKILSKKSTVVGIEG